MIQALVKVIANSSTLKEVELDVMSEFFNDCSHPPNLPDSFLEALTTNYTMETIRFALDNQPWDDAYTERLEQVLRLNRAGRNYLQTNPESKEACTQLLELVNDDWGCLYYHLRECPFVFPPACRTAWSNAADM